jgi:ParB-like chromosome segregation protein Spo0J
VSLEVVQMPLASLNEYAGNAKVHDEANVEAIRASIRRFGMCDPIGVWTNPQGAVEIVEGHGRKMALEAEGYEVADVIFLDHLTDEERRAYALAHNQTTLMSDFDLDILEAELELLADFDMGDFGFDVGAEDEEPVEVVEDEVPEDAPSMCKVGDVWQLGRHRLMCGSSADGEHMSILFAGGGR